MANFSSNNVTQFFLLPDPLLAKAKILSSATGIPNPTYPDLIAPNITPSSNNKGNNSAFAMGIPTTDAEYVLRAQTSGSLGEATWAWKDSSLANDNNYYGQSDVRYRSEISDPFNSHSSTFRTNCVFGVYNEKLNKEFLFSYQILAPTFYPTGGITAYYRDAGVSKYETGWTVGTSFNIQVGAKRTAQHKLPYHGCDVCCMPDGTFRMAVIANYDISIYSSKDGLEWEAICDRTISRFLGRKAGQIDGIRIVSSGYYLRVVCVEYATAEQIKDHEERDEARQTIDIDDPEPTEEESTLSSYIESWYILGIVSIDGGASWELTNQFDIKPGTVDLTGPKWSFDICSADDQGSFILMVKPDEDEQFGKSRVFYEVKDDVTTEEEYYSYLHLSHNGIKAYNGYLAGGVSSFDGQSNLNIHNYGSWGSHKPYMCRTDSEIVIYYPHICQRNNWLNVKTTPEAMEYGMSVIPIGSNLQTVNWNSISMLDSADTEFGVTGFNCNIRLLPANGKLFWCGGSLSFIHNSYDHLKGLVLGNKGDCHYYKMGGWSRIPIRSFNAGNYPQTFLANKKSLDELNPFQPKGPLFEPYWDVTIGQPASVYTTNPSSGALNLHSSSLNTPFVQKVDNAGNGTFPSQLRMNVYSGSGESFNIFTFQDPGCGAAAQRNSSSWTHNNTWTPVVGICQYDFADWIVSLPPPYPPWSGVYRHQSTPDINWCFVPDLCGSVDPYASISNIPAWQGVPPPDMSIPATNAHGSTIVWTSKTEAERASGADQNNKLIAGVSLNGFMLKEMSLWEPPVTPSTMTKHAMVRCSVRLREDYAVIFDERAGVALATLNPSTAFFKDNFVEFRWGWYPLSVQGTWSKTSRNIYMRTACLLMARAIGQEDWHTTDMVYPKASVDLLDSDYVDPSTYSPADSYNPWHQAVSFGVFPHTALNNGYVVSFKKFGVHRSNDLTTSALAEKLHSDFGNNNTSPWKYVERKAVPRGKRMSGNPVLMDKNIKVVWGGTGGMNGDTYGVSRNYSYNPQSAVAFSSPRNMVRGRTSQGTLILDFEAPDNKAFSHQAVALFNLNVRTGSIRYRNSSSTSNLFSKDFDSKIIMGRVSAISSNGVWTIDYAKDNTDPYTSERSTPIENDSLNSSNKRSYYMEVTNSTSTGTIPNNTAFKIDRQIGYSKFTFSNVTNAVTSSAIVGSTIAIFPDRVFIDLESDVSYQVMRVELDKADKSSDGFGQIGTIVAGRKFDLNVPLDWEYTDSEAPNQTEFKSRGGVYWCYSEGPPVRTLSLSMVGDVSEQSRMKFRNLLRSVSNYAERPLVFFNSATRYQSEEVVLSTYKGSTDLQNDGWYFDSQNLQWKPIGNMSIELEEIV